MAPGAGRLSEKGAAGFRRLLPAVQRRVWHAGAHNVLQSDNPAGRSHPQACPFRRHGSGLQRPAETRLVHARYWWNPHFRPPREQNGSIQWLKHMPDGYPMHEATWYTDASLVDSDIPGAQRYGTAAVAIEKSNGH